MRAGQCGHRKCREDRERLLNFVAAARKEYDEMAKKEVQKAFVYAYEESAKTLLENYLDHVEAYCNWQKCQFRKVSHDRGHIPSSNSISSEKFHGAVHSFFRQ